MGAGLWLAEGDRLEDPKRGAKGAARGRSELPGRHGLLRAARLLSPLPEGGPGLHLMGSWADEGADGHACWCRWAGGIIAGMSNAEGI
jgi:hypothetical protein